MIDERIIKFCRSLYKEDPELIHEMADVRVYLDRVDTEVDMPCINHHVEVKAANDPVFYGNYYVDVFGVGYDSAKIRTVANRIVALLHNRVVSEGGGGLRFFLRDKYSFVENRNKIIRGVCLLFEFRGTDVDLFEAQLNI